MFLSAINEVDYDSYDYLKRIVGDNDCLAPDGNRGYLYESRTHVYGSAAMILRPRDIEVLSQILTYCHDKRIGIIPYGGGSGLVGGHTYIGMESYPAPIVISMEHFNDVEAVDITSMSVTCGAGVRLAEVQVAAEHQGCKFPLDMASRDVCTIGGTLATNAGGLKVLRYGAMRTLCLGVEAVFPCGERFSNLSTLYKDNTGYDISGLLIGSEGTLGIITRATLRLYAHCIDNVTTALMAIDNPDGAIAIMRILQCKLNNTISTFELISPQSIELLRAYNDAAVHVVDIPSCWYVLLEVDGYPKEYVEEVLGCVCQGSIIKRGYIAQSEGQRVSFWKLREMLPAANRYRGAIASHDISLPLGCISDFIHKTERLIDAIIPDVVIGCFGHVGDGNLHYNVFPPKSHTASKYYDRKDDISNIVYDTVTSYNGSISAEHGIGRSKKNLFYAHVCKGKISLMKSIKKALDPHGIMNPGNLL